MNDWKKILMEWGWILPAVISFAFFSDRFSIYYNSDDALNVLMAYDFSLPRDWYCWGQDRGGNLLPMIAHALIRMGVQPIWAASLVRYAFLVAGFLAWRSFLTKPGTRLLFSVAWFFPPERFASLLWLPFGVQVSLLGIFLWLINRIEKAQQKGTLITRVAVATGVATLAVWVSDFSAVVLLAWCLYMLFRHKRSGDFSNVFRLATVGVGLFFLVLGVVFILYAKSTATAISGYSDTPFNSLPEVWAGLNILALETVSLTLFQEGNAWESLWFWGALVMGVMVVVHLRKALPKHIARPYRETVLVGAVCSLLALLFSNWVYDYGDMGVRYFTPIYLFLAWWVVGSLDTIRSQWLKVWVVLLVGIGAISAVLPRIQADREPVVEVYAELDALAPAGLIGEYWNAFIASTHSPHQIKATPDQHSWYRSLDWAEQALDQPSLYLIQDHWLDSFPDQITQFGQRLVRAGEPFRIARSTLCAYEKDRSAQVIPFQAFRMAVDTGWKALEDPWITPGAYPNSVDLISAPFALPSGPSEVEVSVGINGEINDTLVLYLKSGWGEHTWLTDTLFPKTLGDTLGKEVSYVASVCLPRFQDRMECWIDLPTRQTDSLRWIGIQLQSDPGVCP